MVNYEKIRAEAAIAAMQAIISAGIPNKSSSPVNVARDAVSYADAVVKKLKEKR